MFWPGCGVEFKCFLKTRNIYQMLYQGYFQVFKFQCTAVVMWLSQTIPHPTDVWTLKKKGIRNWLVLFHAQAEQIHEMNNRNREK